MNTTKNEGKKKIMFSKVYELYLDFGFEEYRDNSPEDGSCYLGKRLC